MPNMDLHLTVNALVQELGVKLKLVQISREIMEKNRKAPPPFLEVAVLAAEPAYRKATTEVVTTNKKACSEDFSPHDPERTTEVVTTNQGQLRTGTWHYLCIPQGVFERMAGDTIPASMTFGTPTLPIRNKS